MNIGSTCHCEERSDEAILLLHTKIFMKYLIFFITYLLIINKIASLPSR